MSKGPRSQLILIAGVPAVGKSQVGRQFAKQGFRHIDLENQEKLLGSFCADPQSFVKNLADSGPVVLDWGFPPGCLDIVEQLKALGVQIWWLGGDWKRARKQFQRREALKARTGQPRIPVECFDAQRVNVGRVWKEIRRIFNPHIIEVLPSKGRKLSYRAIVDTIMAE